MITVIDDNNELRVEANCWTGREKVFLNKQCVSSKWSIGGSDHIFKYEIEGNVINYEVDINLRWHWFSKYVVIRKNGTIIFTDK